MTSCAQTGGASFGFDRRSLPLNQIVARVAARLWPVKTARNLAARAGTTHRAAEAWLAGQTGLSGEALAELIRSDAGFSVLEQLMGDARPSWWPDFCRAVHVQALERRIADVQRDIEAMK